MNIIDNHIEGRCENYYRISSQIALLDNEYLGSLFAASESSTGWGRNHTIDIGDSKVFVKRVPVTDSEHANLFTTRNLHDLPTYYNYGVGSAGFGVFRELVAHIKTTNWVLNGEIENFPLMYHYRIVPYSGEPAGVDLERDEGYVEYWGGNANIGKYMLDRRNASYELILFLEYIPHVLRPWLLDNPDRIQWALDELRVTIDFLRKNGVTHFDAHYDNILTDGEHTYLTDFGLVLDRNYALREDEKVFFDAHTHYDYGEVLACLTFLINRSHEALSESEKSRIRERYGVQETDQSFDMMPVLIANLKELHADGLMKLNEDCFACLVKYRSVILLMESFYGTLRGNKRKDTPFPHEELKRLLAETEFVSDTATIVKLPA